MSFENENLYEKYKINMLDQTKIFHYCINDRKEEAIKYIQLKVRNNYKIAETIVNAYIEEMGDVIEDRKRGIEEYKERQLNERVLNKPKCPTCQSINIKKVSTTSRVINTAIYGIFGTKRYKTFHCNNCGYEW